MSADRSQTRREELQLFVPLGFYRMRYYFRTEAGGVMWFTSQHLCKLGGALDIVPDVEHWRRLYPLDSRAIAVDWVAAGAYLMRVAQEAGRYYPGFDEGPGTPGPRAYTPAEKLEAYRRRRQKRRVAVMENEAAEECRALGLTNAQMQRRERERRQRETPGG